MKIEIIGIIEYTSFGKKSLLLGFSKMNTNVAIRKNAIRGRRGISIASISIRLPPIF